MIIVENGYPGCDACRTRSKRHAANAASYSRSWTTLSSVSKRHRKLTLQYYGKCLTNFVKFHKLRASTKSKLLFVFVLFSAINKRHLPEAAAARSPQYFVGLEEVLERSRCSVREEIVDIRKEHPTLPSEAIYTPSCVALNRCSGCCQSETQQCVPTSIYTTRMEIDQEIQSPFSYDTLTLEFTQHASCACRSLDDTRRVCVQRECEEGETWDPEGCSCVITLDIMCVPRICGDNEIWNDATCQCQPSCQPENCYPGEQWNSSSCTCTPICPEVRRCPYGQTWNIRECRCEEKCPTQSCGTHQIWNPESCRCQCKPCHSSRLYHERFFQNFQTCRCACRSKHRLIEACRKRGAEFNTKTCTCERNYANRGRRG